MGIAACVAAAFVGLGIRRLLGLRKRGDPSVAQGVLMAQMMASQDLRDDAGGGGDIDTD